jgi:hypothetical protein
MDNERLAGEVKKRSVQQLQRIKLKENMLHGRKLRKNLIVVVLIAMSACFSFMGLCTRDIRAGF